MTNEIDRFELYGVQRRRRVVGFLALHDIGATIDVRGLARVLAAIEEETLLSSVASSSEYRSRYTGLIQSHLPKLDAAGILDYDEDEKNVTVTKQTVRDADMLGSMEVAALSAEEFAGGENHD